MTKQTKSLKQFSELTSSELHRISGGDWWSELIRLLPHKHRKVNSNNHIIK